MKYIFIKLEVDGKISFEEYKDSILDAFCTWYNTEIKVYKPLTEEQADYVEYSIIDNPI